MITLLTPGSGKQEIGPLTGLWEGDDVRTPSRPVLPQGADGGLGSPPKGMKTGVAADGTIHPRASHDLKIVQKPQPAQDTGARILDSRNGA